MNAQWSEDREKILQRLAKVKELIRQKDEGGTLALLNQQDEFCQDAETIRSAEPQERADEPSCHFCIGFQQAGGCLSMVDRIDHAVLNGDWEEAGRLTDEYAAWLRSLALPS